MTSDDLKTLGFPSWFALYAFLREKQQHESVRVRVVCPRPISITTTKAPKKPEPEIEVTVNVEYVKARAFEELYASLPTRETLDILIETSQEATLKFLDARLITSYLAKQPTRTQ